VRRSDKIAFLVLALGIVVVLGVSLAGGSDRREGWEAHDVAEARLGTVREASLATIPNTALVAADSDGVQGERAASGPLVTYALTLRRRLDFAEIHTDDARGGPLAPLLRLAEAQERALEKGGFCPMAAEWSTRGSTNRTRVENPDEMVPLLALQGRPLGDGAPPHRRSVHVSYFEQHDSGGGSGGYLVDLNQPVIVHQRIYAVPQSGATLFVRNAYDQSTRIVNVEFAYADRTLFGVEYPTGSYIKGRQPGHYQLREAIDRPD